MIDFNTLQDAINGYRYLEENNSENDYRFVLDTLRRSCNRSAKEYVNQAKEYSSFAVDMLRVWLYEFAREAVKDFIKQGPEKFVRLDYYTILITIREITKDNNLKNDAKNLYTYLENCKNDSDIMTNQITDLCVKFVTLS
jgi:hypothetical protein